MIVNTIKNWIPHNIGIEIGNLYLAFEFCLWPDGGTEVRFCHTLENISAIRQGVTLNEAETKILNDFKEYNGWDNIFRYTPHFCSFLYLNEDSMNDAELTEGLLAYKKFLLDNKIILENKYGAAYDHKYTLKLSIEEYIDMIVEQANNEEK